MASEGIVNPSVFLSIVATEFRVVDQREEIWALVKLRIVTRLNTAEGRADLREADICFFSFIFRN